MVAIAVLAASIACGLISVWTLFQEIFAQAPPFLKSCVILTEGKRLKRYQIPLLEIQPFRDKEVMPMTDSSKRVGHQAGVNRLCAGAVL